MEPLTPVSLIILSKSPYSPIFPLPIIGILWPRASRIFFIPGQSANPLFFPVCHEYLPSKSVRKILRIDYHELWKLVHQHLVISSWCRSYDLHLFRGVTWRWQGRKLPQLGKWDNDEMMITNFFAHLDEMIGISKEKASVSKFFCKSLWTSAVYVDGVDIALKSIKLIISRILCVQG